MLEKAAALDVDEVVVDLEDGTAAADKDAARANLAAAGARGTLAVRINGVGTPWWRDDLAAVAPAPPGVVVLPKAESADDVAAVLELLPAGVGLEVQIETARGLVEVERIAALGAPLEALVFGPGDFAASIGVPTLDDRRGVLRLRARADRRRRPGVRPPAGRRPLRDARRRRRPARLRRARARARLRRQVGDPPGADRAGERRLHAVRGGARARPAHPRGRRRGQLGRRRDGRCRLEAARRRRHRARRAFRALTRGRLRTAAIQV